MQSILFAILVVISVNIQPAEAQSEDLKNLQKQFGQGMTNLQEQYKLSQEAIKRESKRAAAFWAAGSAVLLVPGINVLLEEVSVERVLVGGVWFALSALYGSQAVRECRTAFR